MQIREEERAVDEEMEGQPERQLDGVPLDVQEAWICEDLMFVLQVSLIQISTGRYDADTIAGSGRHPDTL